MFHLSKFVKKCPVIKKEVSIHKKYHCISNTDI